MTSNPPIAAIFKPGICFAKLMAVLAVGAFTHPPGAASLRQHIVGVVPCIAKPQMGGVYATPIVTCVQYEPPRRDRAIVKFVTDAMSEKGTSSARRHNLSVANSRRRPLPEPAAVGFSDSTPESLFKWADDATSTIDSSHADFRSRYSSTLLTM